MLSLYLVSVVSVVSVSLYLVLVVSLGTLVEVSLITLSAWVEDGLVINGKGVVLFCLITVSDVIVLLEFVCAIIAFVVVGIVALVFVVLAVWTPVLEAVAVLKRRRRKKELVITVTYLACENIRFSSFFAAGAVSRGETSLAAKSEEKRMFSQAITY